MVADLQPQQLSSYLDIAVTVTSASGPAAVLSQPYFAHNSEQPGILLHSSNELSSALPRQHLLSGPALPASLHQLRGRLHDRPQCTASARQPLH